MTVVVDASFGHRIDPRELPTFEEAEAAGDVVSPPAGAIGRGDAFLLRIAQKTGATVLSNDSFQEFHAEHPWLFDKGRLVGGKPVPGVGWIFMERTPVRGPKSREVVKEARRRKDTTAASTPAAETETQATAEPAGRGERRPKLAAAPKQRSKTVDRAIETATHEVVDPSAGGSRRRSRPPADPVNEPLAFISFIASHPLGSLVDAVVFEYSSHGAFVEADGARCYVPLSAMGDPAPRSAREIMGKGEVVSLVVQALDPQRRGIELAMPGHEHVSGAPTPETVEAETLDEVPGVGGPVSPRRSSRRRSSVSEAEDISTGLEAATPEAPAAKSAPAKRAPAKRAPARKASARSDEDSAAEATVPSARPAKAPARVAKSAQALDEAEFGEAGPSETAPTKRAPRATKTAAAPPAAKAAQATKALRSAKETVKVAPATKTAATKTAATVRRSAATSAAKSATASKAVASAKAVKAVTAVKAVKVAAAVKAAASGPAAKKAAGSVAKKATGSATKTAKTVKPVEPAARTTKSRGTARKTPAGS